MKKSESFTEKATKSEPYHVSRQFLTSQIRSGSKPLVARVLRVLATYILNLKSDLPKTKSLASQARELDPDADDSILKTMIVYHENDATSALEMIKATPNIDIFNFQLALLLELRRTDEIISMIEEIPAHLVVNAETRRLHAWALITKGELIGAQKQIQIAITEQPSWQSVRFLAAVIGYLSALSPAVLPLVRSLGQSRSTGPL